MQVFLVCSVTRRLCCLSIQRNLDITKFSVQGTIFLISDIIRYMKKNLDITKPRYSERILTIRSPLYYNQFFWPGPGKTAIHFRVSF